MADRHQAWARLLLLISAHGIITLTHSRKSVPRYGRHRVVLYLHILSGLVETFRFAFQDVWSEPPPAGLSDIILCCVQSGTNATLVWNLQMGIPKYTRPSYLTGAIIRPLLTISSYLTSSAKLHRSSIYLLDAFIYARLLIFLLRPYAPRYSLRYAISITGSAVIASATAGWAGANEGDRIKGGVRAVVGYMVMMGSMVVIREGWKKRTKQVKEEGDHVSLVNRKSKDIRDAPDYRATLLGHPRIYTACIDSLEFVTERHRRVSRYT